MVIYAVNRAYLRNSNLCLKAWSFASHPWLRRNESAIRAAERPDDCGARENNSTTVADRVKTSSISSSGSFNLSSARLNKPQGLDVR
jgi:hypothetical protein